MHMLTAYLQMTDKYVTTAPQECHTLPGPTLNTQDNLKKCYCVIAEHYNVKRDIPWHFREW